MKKAQKLDKQKVVEIIQQSFANNPTLLFLIRNAERKHKMHYIGKIASYAFDFALRREGVYLSDSGKGVAICFKYNFLKQDLLDIINLLKLLISAFALRRILKILRHSNYVKRVRPADGEYLYFWFFGVLPEEFPRTSGRELAKEIMKMAEDKHLDIYAETTIEKNKIVYERFGFEVYQKWYNVQNNINVWFMRRRVEG